MRFPSTCIDIISVKTTRPADHFLDFRRLQVVRVNLVTHHAKDHRSSTSLKQSIEGNDILNICGMLSERKQLSQRKETLYSAELLGSQDLGNCGADKKHPEDTSQNWKLLSQVGRILQASCCIASSDKVPRLWTNHHPQHPQPPRSPTWPGGTQEGINIPKLIFKCSVQLKARWKISDHVVVGLSPFPAGGMLSSQFVGPYYFSHIAWLHACPFSLWK